MEALGSLWENDTPTLLEIVQEIYRSSLFPLTQELEIIAARTPNESEADEPEEDLQDEKIQAWDPLSAVST